MLVSKRPRRADPLPTGSADNILEVLTDEVLVSVAGHLGIQDQGRLSCVCHRFAKKSLKEPQRKDEVAAASAAVTAGASKVKLFEPYCKKFAEVAAWPVPEGFSLEVQKTIAAAVAGVAAEATAAALAATAQPPVLANIAGVASKLAIDAKSQAERDLWPRRANEPWLCNLYRMEQAPRWARYGAELFTVREGGALLTGRGGDFYSEGALATVGGGPMVVGGAMAVYYVELEIRALEFHADDDDAFIMLGIGRPDLDVDDDDERTDVIYESADFWGLYSGNGDHWHAGEEHQWAGQHEGFVDEGDTLGFCLDCEAGRLIVYKRGAPTRDEDGDLAWDRSVEGMTRLGVMVEGLTGEFCWVGAFYGPGSTVRITAVRITAEPPPVGWRKDESVVDWDSQYD